ncbi:hypothetical protein KIPB_007499 [Kipferlia bialata]|uniref:Cupin type-2 domain-containing protein n=1 Tax=Kipferlia bialata TaxID=797122 RepID=A0A391NMH5_9EUKA|nr:hypothetical protein KIPB_007499 [Kipferlia bialata]|eukprot:g7499.t1
MRHITLAKGGNTPQHTHAWEHEVYVLEGCGELYTPSGYKPIMAGDCIMVPPHEEHQFRNAGDDVFKFICLVPNSAP